uniref:Uncharacterized protein n=1 Tax=Myoviridae sp. ctpvf97 TaxID=2825176 RepID=A0A8S5TW08_9CAUD|nr:MAG TPA: hypothetical protein [Myoviridae sp. ctpvf97]
MNKVKIAYVLRGDVEREIKKQIRPANSPAQNRKLNAVRFGVEMLSTTELVEVQGKLVCDPLSADKPEAIGSEVRRKAREMLMEELERKGLIRYQMLNGVLYAGIRAAAPEEWRIIPTAGSVEQEG